MAQSIEISNLLQKLIFNTHSGNVIDFAYQNKGGSWLAIYLIKAESEKDLVLQKTLITLDDI